MTQPTQSDSLDETVDDLLDTIYERGYEHGIDNLGATRTVRFGREKSVIAAHYAAKEQEAVLRARMEGHELGFRAGISAFSGYYMDASLPAQRHPILPDIARELLDNYHVYSYFANIPDLTNQLNQMKGEK